MKKKTIAQLREMDLKTLSKELEEAMKEKMSITMHLAAQSEKDNSKMGKVKAYIAQIKTVRRGKELDTLPFVQAA